MGVDNLLGFVKNATTMTNVNDIGLANSSAAVDISHWIYKACYACPEQMYHRTNVNQIYNTIVNYIENYVTLLKFLQVELTFVFDGMKLPAKHVTHQERAAKKQDARRLVEKFLAKKDFTEARRHMLRCFDITYDLVQQVIQYCKRKSIKYVVAPYEADAQLAWLERQNLCKFIITEDSDLILYGCQKIIYKLDHTNGQCLLYERDKLAKCLGPRGDTVSFDKFRRMCILSGCDYLKNIPNVGLQTAKKFFLITQQDNLRLLLPKLAIHLKSTRLSGKVTEEYVNGFIDAETTFKHHIVYDPLSEKLKPLEEYPRGKSSRDFPMAGKRFHHTLATELARGNIDLDALNPEADLDSASDESDIEPEEGGDSIETT